MYDGVGREKNTMFKNVANQIALQLSINFDFMALSLSVGYHLYA